LDDLAAGRLTVSGFVDASSRLIRTEYGIVFSLGALSVSPFHTLTIKDVRVIDAELAQERRILRSFATDVVRGFYVLDPTRRAGLYLQALRGMFELGRIQALPEGPYIWVLGETEHCIPCFDASVGGPYQRTSYSGLGLTVLPGIPGSGDLCQGLTRCGCRVRMATFAIPNEDIQQEIKDVLIEILHDTS
jgi:hypothetical protein